MITTIRRHFKQSTYRYVVFTIIFIIGLSMVSSMFMIPDKSIPSWSIRVNGSDISYKDFMQEVHRQDQYMAYIRSQYGDLAELIFQSMGWSSDSKTRAIDSLIKDELLYQYAAKMGLVISPSYITYALNSPDMVRDYLSNIVPAGIFDQSGTLNALALKSFLKTNNITAQDFEQSIEKALLKAQVLDIIAQLAPAPLFELQQQFIAKNLAKNYSYAFLEMNDFLQAEKKISLSDEEVKAFYDDQNLKVRRYWVPEKRSVLVWEFNPNDYKIAISDEEVERYYEQNKVKLYVLDPLRVEIDTLQLTNYGQQSLEEVRAALIESPEKFSGWKRKKAFARTQASTDIEKAAFLLTKEGEVSQIVMTPEGPVVAKLVQRIQRTYKPLSTVKGEIVATLTKKAFEKSFAKDISSLIKKDAGLVDSFILDKAGKKETITGVVKNDTRLSQEAFRLNTNEYGFYIQNGKGYLALLTAITPKYLPDCESIKEEVRSDLYTARAENRLSETMKRIKDLAQTESLSEITERYGLKWEKTGWILPSDYQKVQKLEKQGLMLNDALSWEKVGSLVAEPSEKGGMILKLDEIKSYEVSDFIAAKSDLMSKSGNLSKRVFVESFVASLYRNATIETNESIITQD